MVHELGGHHAVVGGGVVPHGLEGGVSGDGVQGRLWQLLPQELGHLGNLLAEILWETGQCSPLLPPPRLLTPSTTAPHLLQVLVEEVKDGVILPPLPVALDVVVPGAICHCVEGAARGCQWVTLLCGVHACTRGCLVPPLPAMNSSRYWAHVPGCGCNLFIRSKW